MDISSFGAAPYFRPWSWPKWLQCKLANETMPSPSFHTAGIRQRHALFQGHLFHLHDSASDSSLCRPITRHSIHQPVDRGTRLAFVLTPTDFMWPHNTSCDFQANDVLLRGLALTKTQDSTCWWPVQLGSHPGPTIMPKIPELPRWMADSNFMAGISCRHCIRGRNSGARPSDTESSRLRLPKMAWNASLLCGRSIFALHQHIPRQVSPSDRVVDALLSYPGILRYLDPLSALSSSSVSASPHSNHANHMQCTGR